MGSTAFVFTPCTGRPPPLIYHGTQGFIKFCAQETIQYVCFYSFISYKDQKAGAGMKAPDCRFCCSGFRWSVSVRSSLQNSTRTWKWRTRYHKQRWCLFNPMKSHHCNGWFFFFSHACPQRPSPEKIQKTLTLPLGYYLPLQSGWMHLSELTEKLDSNHHNLGQKPLTSSLFLRLCSPVYWFMCLPL